MKVYFLSGIAADSRLFKHIRLPKGFEAEFIDWIKPIRNESLTAYAFRLSEKINTTEPFLIIGTSMGGILASEISIRHNPLATIIIGSVPVKSQLPGYYNWVGRLKIQKIIPGSFYKFAAITKHFFSRAAAQDTKIIIKMIRESDPAFIYWGIDAVLQWENKQMPQSFFHIHGTRDEVFPFANTAPTHTIKKGGHMLVMTHAEEINMIIKEILNSINSV
jgi:pimeloyl-ACP methyl ester carboxylesterase